MASSSFAPLAPLRRWHFVLAAGLLVGAVFLAYSAVWDGRFIWDDGFLVAANPFTRSPLLLLECFRHYLFTDSVSQFYRPVQNISYFFDYWRGGLAPAVYHQTNLLLHGLNAALLFVLARRWMAPLGWLAALALAFLWALHPIHSATAAYISGRADSLALLFFLGGWWCWERGLQTVVVRRRIVYFAFSGVAGLLAMCSKEIAAEALLLFVLHVWVVRTDLPSKIRLQSTLASIILFACYYLLRHLPEPNLAPNQAPNFPAFYRLELFFRALGDYFRLLVWPDRLYMERQIVDQGTLLRPPASFDPLFPWLGWLGGVFLLLLAAAVWWKGDGRRLRIFGALWFFVMILPVSNLFPLNATVAEHWLYFPSIGFLLFLAGCWSGFRLCGLVPAVLVVVAIGGLAARTSLRAVDWNNALTFYKATIRDGGDSPRMRINLAAEYRKLGQPSEAEKLYRSVLDRMPTYTWAKMLYAELLRAESRPTEADKLLETVPAARSRAFQDRSTYVSQLLLADRLDEAQRTARLLYEGKPDAWQAASLYAHTFRRKDQAGPAVIIVRGFASRHWWHAESHQLLGDLLAETGTTDEAIAAWNQVARLDIHEARAYAMCAALLSDNSRFQDAESYQRKSIDRQPTAAAWTFLAQICRSNHDEAGAKEAEREAALIPAKG